MRLHCDTKNKQYQFNGFMYNIKVLQKTAVMFLGVYNCRQKVFHKEDSLHHLHVKWTEERPPFIQHLLRCLNGKVSKQMKTSKCLTCAYKRNMPAIKRNGPKKTS